MNVKKTLKLKDDSIRVKSADELLKADELLSGIGVDVFSDNKKRKEYATKTIDGHLIQEADGGWRIQSHYIGFGTQVDVLEVKIAKYKSKQSTLFSELELGDLVSLVDNKILVRLDQIRDCCVHINRISSEMLIEPKNTSSRNGKIRELSDDIMEHNSVIKELEAELKEQ